jgi:hypothetical protein
MPDSTLRDLILKRLDAAAADANEWHPLAMAALEGPGEPAKLLEHAGGLSSRARAVTRLTALDGAVGMAI